MPRTTRFLMAAARTAPVRGSVRGPIWASVQVPAWVQVWALAGALLAAPLMAAGAAGAAPPPGGTGTGAPSSSAGAAAAPETVTQAAAGEEALVARINAYLNALTNIEGRFLQIGPDGTLAEGRFHLARPGRARFDYDTEDLVVVARGQRLYIKEGAFVSNELPLEGTPLKVLLGRNVDIARDTEIVALDARAGTVAVTLRDREAPELGQVTLIFTGPRTELARWIVTDAQGLRTTVTLSGVSYPARIDPDLFRLESGRDFFRGRQD